jgi:hypothetical protein
MAQDADFLLGNYFGECIDDILAVATAGEGRAGKSRGRGGGKGGHLG